MSLSTNRFFRVQLPRSPSAVPVQDQSIAVYVTDQASDQFIDNLYLYASEQTEVEQIFGTSSDIAKATAKAFGHPLRPRQVVIVYWNKTGVAVIARPNSLTATASPIPFVNLKPSYNFTIRSRNITEVVSYTADAEVTGYNSFVVALNEALSPTSRFVFSYANGVFALTSKVNGADVDTDNITLEIDSLQVNNIADDLRLTTNRGVKQVRGINGSTPAAQTIIDLISELDDKHPNYYGFYNTVMVTDQEIEDTHDRLLASNRFHIYAMTALADYMLDFDQTNPLYRIASKNSQIMLVQLNKLGDKNAAVEAMVQISSTNWEGRNTAQTLKFKNQSSVQSDEGITTTLANRADRLGINYYTDYDGTTFLAEGRTVGTEIFFADSTVGRHALATRLQATGATRLIQQPKIPQTDEGQITLESSLISVLEQFVRNGFLGRGLTWNGLGFGELTTGQILETGYYLFSDSYALQSQSDREARKAMPIQIAAKEAGAIHSADILLYMER